MKEIATLIPEDEFREFMYGLEDEVNNCKSQGMGYISIRNQLVSMLVDIEDQDMVFTVRQLREIFDLAK